MTHAAPSITGSLRSAVALDDDEGPQPHAEKKTNRQQEARLKEAIPEPSEAAIEEEPGEDVRQSGERVAVRRGLGRALLGRVVGGPFSHGGQSTVSAGSTHGPLSLVPSSLRLPNVYQKW